MPSITYVCVAADILKYIRMLIFKIVTLTSEIFIGGSVNIKNFGKHFEQKLYRFKLFFNVSIVFVIKLLRIIQGVSFPHGVFFMKHAVYFLIF